MIQIVQTTDKQKMKMYMKVKKKELCKMLIQANKLLEIRPEIKSNITWMSGDEVISTFTSGGDGGNIIYGKQN